MKNVVKITIPRGSKLHVKQTMNNIAYAKPKLISKPKPKTKKA